MTARIFVAFSFTFLLSMFFRTFFAVVGPELARELELSPVQFGVLSSAFFACFSVMQVPVGILFDRFGCRTPMTVLIICGATGTAMIAAASSFTQALLGQGLLGIGCAPALMGIYFYYGRELPWQKAARVATMIAAIGSLGALISATPFELLVSQVGWRYAVGMSACCMSAASCLLYLSVQSDGRAERAASDEKTSSSSNTGFLIFLAPIFLSASLGTVFRSACLAFEPAQNIFFAGLVLSALYAIGNCHTIALAEAQSHISDRRRGLILGILNGLGFIGVASFSPLFGVIARSMEQSLAFTAMFSATAAVLTGSLIVYMLRNRMV